MLAYDGRPREGYDLLLGVEPVFPSISGIPFQLAECVALAEMWQEALHWVTRAIWLAPYLKPIALDIKMFEQIWPQIQEIQVRV